MAVTALPPPCLAPLRKHPTTHLSLLLLWGGEPPLRKTQRVVTSGLPLLWCLRVEWGAQRPGLGAGKAGPWSPEAAGQSQMAGSGWSAEEDPQPHPASSCLWLMAYASEDGQSTQADAKDKAGVNTLGGHFQSGGLMGYHGDPVTAVFWVAQLGAWGPQASPSMVGLKRAPAPPATFPPGTAALAQQPRDRHPVPHPLGPGAPCSLRG